MALFMLIRSGTVHLAGGGKVIPQEELGELKRASELVQLAQSELEESKKQAAEEAEKLKLQAREEGRQEGLVEFQKHLLQFDEKLQRIRIEMQKQILPLALKAAKKIVGEQLTLAPEIIVEIVIQALAPVVQNHRFTIYVNKADKEVLEEKKPEIRALLEHVQSLVIAERNDVPPGGCIIETESGIINATLENQWKALEVAFTKYTQPKK
jgi:type III secretion protein L